MNVIPHMQISTQEKPEKNLLSRRIIYIIVNCYAGVGTRGCGFYGWLAFLDTIIVCGTKAVCNASEKGVL